jgi:hypothetical protein
MTPRGTPDGLLSPGSRAERFDGQPRQPRIRSLAPGFWGRAWTRAYDCRQPATVSVDQAYLPRNGCIR